MSNTSTLKAREELLFWLPLLKRTELMELIVNEIDENRLIEIMCKAKGVEYE